MLAEEIEQVERKGVYWGISRRILEERPRRAPKYLLPQTGSRAPLLKDSERTRELAEIGTRLNRFSEERQENLINWGYALADARMRQYVIGFGDEVPLGKLPFPNRLV